jgi:drug/metabolite transporter (DMT)-like permease
MGHSFAPSWTGKPGDVFALGLGAALLASALVNVGAALQALEARTTPQRLGLRLPLLVALAKRWRWLLGLFLALIAVAPQVLAFATAPFVVVQTALTAGLLLLLLLGVVMLDERVRISAWIGVLAIVSGVALVSWGAPAHSETHRGGFVVIGVVAALVAGALAPWAVRGSRFDSSLLLIVASGIGFAGANVTTKLMSDDAQSAHWPIAIPWAVLGLAMGVAATLTGMTAFQRRAASVVVPLSTTVQTFLPILLAPLFLREALSSAQFVGMPILAGLGAAFVGTILVARTEGVSRLAAAGAAD